MKSFVERFIDKRISIETLHRMLCVDYQRNTFLELVIDGYVNDNFEIQECNHFFLKLENSKYCIFVLLSKEKRTLLKIQKQIENLNHDVIVFSVIFDQNDTHSIVNPIYINPKDWMNRIISHGINRQILDLQFLRDLEFSYE